MAFTELTSTFEEKCTAFGRALIVASPLLIIPSAQSAQPVAQSYINIRQQSVDGTAAASFSGEANINGEKHEFDNDNFGNLPSFAQAGKLKTKLSKAVPLKLDPSLFPGD